MSNVYWRRQRWTKREQDLFEKANICSEARRLMMCYLCSSFAKSNHELRWNKIRNSGSIRGWLGNDIWSPNCGNQDLSALDRCRSKTQMNVMMLRKEVVCVHIMLMIWSLIKIESLICIHVLVQRAYHIYYFINFDFKLKFIFFIIKQKKTTNFSKKHMPNQIDQRHWRFNERVQKAQWLDKVRRTKST